MPFPDRLQKRLSHYGGTLKKFFVSSAALLLIAVLSACSGAGESAAPAASTGEEPTPTSTVTKRVTVTPSPTPASIKTSGSYKADLAALGVMPDNVQSFAEWMEAQICDETGSSLGVSVRSIGGNETGGGIDGVRLTVAYFCPEKSQEVESYLEYFKK